MKMRHFDVQLLGGMSLHHGKISEMGTGEGKTLTATMPVYLNALSGKGVHVVTVNDYLANRDAQWMGKLYNFLGLSVGINLPNMAREEKQAAYPADITLMHHLYAALRAKHLYFRDQHYVVQNGEIVIVDEFTGRLMTGRRWSEGLHQAVEAKEGVAIQPENQTMASITFQNYFRLYGKLAGMTGTADTEAYEFQEIYGLETLVIPYNNCL